jgi:hypothetical protein
MIAPSQCAVSLLLAGQSLSGQFRVTGVTGAAMSLSLRDFRLGCRADTMCSHRMTVQVAAVADGSGLLGGRLGGRCDGVLVVPPEVDWAHMHDGSGLGQAPAVAAGWDGLAGELCSAAWFSVVTSGAG